jgi:hypothetical protein
MNKFVTLPVPMRLPKMTGPEIPGLIVVGNQGLGRRFSRLRHFLMGSVSEKVSRYARCSVMVVRRDLHEQRQV